MDKQAITYIREWMNSRGKECVESVLEYITMAGFCSEGEFDDYRSNLAEKLDFLLGRIQIGDIIYTQQGLFLVTDDKPQADPDKKHFRALKVKVDQAGHYTICSEQRSSIFRVEDAFRIKKSSFDMKRVEKCSYERYLAYKKISEINEELKNLREEDESE